MEWNQLKSLDDLEQAIANSALKTVVLFKHSTRCSVSAMAKRNFESQWNVAPEKAEGWLLDLIRYREVSNAIAERFDIGHESPQMIVVKNAHPAYHASHGMISAVHPEISG